ncbi:MAG: hypothetical protein U0704_00435 [Candidatus Eisenbacteria bacterium]
MRLRPLDERGLTLTEVTIVAAIGTLVLLGMGGFYLQSQATWIDASGQALTQREVTLVTQAIVDSTRLSHAANVVPSPDATHHQLELAKDGTSPPFYRFWWNSSDSLVHAGSAPGAPDDHAMMSSPVEQFVITASSQMVRVSLRARAATGQRVEFTGSARMRN